MSPTVKLLHTQPMPKLCKNCKYYQPYPSNYKPMRESLGKCTYEKKVDLVSGDISYEYASIVREYTCKEEFYVEQEKPVSSWEQLKWFFLM